MILLDTDHVTILRMPPSDRRTRLVSKLAAVQNETIGIPVIVVEEIVRGWMSAIAKERHALRQTFAYRELSNLFQFLTTFQIVTFDDAAAMQFDELVSAKIRVGSMDLKIAATALVNKAVLITANRRDFEKVPNLRLENWADTPPPTN